jgi:hypothetical protein
MSSYDADVLIKTLSRISLFALFNYRLCAFPFILKLSLCSCHTNPVLLTLKTHLDNKLISKWSLSSNPNTDSILTRSYCLFFVTGPWALASDFHFHEHLTDGRAPWTSDQLVARPLYLNTE